MFPGVEAQLLGPDARAQLESMVDLVDATAVDLTALPAERLARIEIVVGGWGCNVLDDDLLARMPKLRLLAYGAGSVKHTATPATWEHGVLVSSAAAANAVPVAEFTFAAIVMIAKDVFRTRDRHRETRGREAVAGSGPTGALGTRGARVGVIGASATGRLVITRLQSLEVSIAVSDPYLDDDGARSLGATRMDLDDLFPWADIVTVHAP
ncbi:MAG TPA: NAD(P)-dependent oxidoreductase, partial [Acidimicrobiia bacterium]|nr:NAD(P)-dependent oxidoreductase [Acidimicrobiia bacterium]